MKKITFGKAIYPIGNTKIMNLLFDLDSSPVTSAATSNTVS
jgi:hypothetical protein